MNISLAGCGVWSLPLGQPCVRTSISKIKSTADHVTTSRDPECAPFKK